MSNTQTTTSHKVAQSLAFDAVKQQTKDLFTYIKAQNHKARIQAKKTSNVLNSLGIDYVGV